MKKTSTDSLFSEKVPGTLKNFYLKKYPFLFWTSGASDKKNRALLGGESGGLRGGVRAGGGLVGGRGLCGGGLRGGGFGVVRVVGRGGLGGRGAGGGSFGDVGLLCLSGVGAKSHGSFSLVLPGEKRATGGILDGFFCFVKGVPNCYARRMSEFVLSSGVGLHKRIDYAQELNQEQLDVVLHGDGACLVLAGAGSGKTRTLTYRVAYLLEQGVDPASILLLTFTNKASREMLDRVKKLLGNEAVGLWGGTFHSIGSRVLRSFADTLGYASSFSIMDSEDAGDLLKALIKEFGIDTKAKRFPSTSVVQDVISYSRNAQETIRETMEWKYPHFQDAAAKIEEIATVYQTRKKAANMVDFDDLLALLALLLEDPAYGPSIAQRFHYVLVDEYQDTNALQARIVKGFSQVHKQVLVVGDDAQSIYAFRGADVQNILSFPKRWPDAKIFKLLTNYRSTPQILEVANESLRHNQDQFEKDLVAMGKQGEKPKLVPCQSASQEARYVADQLMQLRSQGRSLKEIAVLFRSSAHSQSLEFELMKRDLPYEYRGGQKFFERAHIKDAICFLRLRHNPKDEVAWLRILQLQPGIGATSAAHFAKQSGLFTSWGEIKTLPIASAWKGKAREGWTMLSALLDDLGTASEWPSTVLRRLLGSSYKRYLEQEYPNWRDRLEDLEQLALFAEAYQDTGAFLADIALYDDVVAARQEAGAHDQERLVLSTIHQAKGLEWDSVFVIHLADQSFPSRRALNEEGGMEEERRLFYVAVTRARRDLFLTYPMTLGFDTLQFQHPSTFIEEVSPRLFDRVELRDPYAARGFFPKASPVASWDSGEEWVGDGETVIEQDRSGERRLAPSPTMKTAWKSSKTPPAATGLSFLRAVDEL